MSIDIHTISQIDGMPFANTDKVRMGMLNQAYPAGASAGAASTVNVAAMIPPNAIVLPGNVAGAYVDISNVTNTGFTMTVTPRNSANTLAAGSAGVFIVA